MILYVCEDCATFPEVDRLYEDHTGHRVIAIEGDDEDALHRVGAKHLEIARRLIPVLAVEDDD